MNIEGSYTIKQGNKIIVQKKNLITHMGESFFMNRAINNEFEPLAYILLGTSPFRVKKTDVGLGAETFRKKAITEIDWDKKQIRLICNCTLEEIINTCEIGTSNGSILISHDSYTKLSNEDFENDSDSVEIIYIFYFSTSSVRGGWLYYTQGDSGGTSNHIYYLVEENTVLRVHDELQNGYHRVSSIDDLKTIHGAYYYDPFSKNLYIRTINNEDPNVLKISITTE